VPVVIVKLDKQDEKKLNLALNKIQGEWDHEKLSELLHSLDDIKITGFDETGLAFIDDIAGFGSGGALEDDEFLSADELHGETVDQAIKLSFYFEDATLYERLHKFFGGKSNHDVKLLERLVNDFEQRQVQQPKAN